MSSKLTTQGETLANGTASTNLDFPKAMQNIGDHKNILIPLSKKESPTHLAESINSEEQGIGAHIYVKGGHKILYQTNKFTLQAFSFNLQERSQILNTFGASSVSFFGDSARVYNFSGAAVDYRSTRSEREHEYFHGSSLIKMYNDVIRGTQLVKNNQIAYIVIGNHQVEGYPLSFNSTYSSNADKIVTFNMSWVVTNHSLDAGAPEVLSENDLRNMYVPSVDIDKVISQYVKKIDSILGPLNNFITLNMYSDKVLGGQDIREFVDYGPEYFLKIDDIFKKIDPSINIVKEMRERAVACKEAVLKFYTNSDSYISPILAVVFGASESNVETFFTTILSAIESIADDEIKDDSFKFSELINKLHTLPEKLYSLKAKHIK